MSQTSHRKEEFQLPRELSRYLESRVSTLMARRMSLSWSTMINISEKRFNQTGRINWTSKKEKPDLSVVRWKLPRGLLHRGCRHPLQLSCQHPLKKLRQWLSEIKETHSKVHKIEYSELKLQPILVSKHSEITIKEKQFDESARTRMLDLKKNFKVRATDTKCRGCETEEENTGKPSLPGSERHQSSQRGASLQWFIERKSKENLHY